MQRGVIEFSAPGIDYLLPKLSQSPQDTNLLQQKLQHAKESGQNPKIELSEEELDILLDCLPMPQSSEDQTVTQLRKSLTDFLQQMRNPEAKQPGSLSSKLNPLNWFK